MSNTIVFIHEAWLTKLSWENLIPYFEQKGYTCIVPKWPYRDKSVEELRQNTAPEDCLSEHTDNAVDSRYSRVNRAEARIDVT